MHADIFKVVLWVLIAGHMVGAMARRFYWKTNGLRRKTVG